MRTPLDTFDWLEFNRLSHSLPSQPLWEGAESALFHLLDARPPAPGEDQAGLWAEAAQQDEWLKRGDPRYDEGAREEVSRGLSWFRWVTGPSAALAGLTERLTVGDWGTALRLGAPTGLTDPAPKDVEPLTQQEATPERKAALLRWAAALPSTLTAEELVRLALVAGVSPEARVSPEEDRGRTALWRRIYWLAVVKRHPLVLNP